ncbi:DUF397 domain-containing protein [Streptomyces sp. AC154]|uniref:DUF397 domain-containing protein n=1 Tax=Streptomyces sp. AC154 TaxID=3143184 RepID=UPI003F7E93CB
MGPRPPVGSWSSYCAQGNSCVHVATHNGTVILTESGDPGGAILRTTPADLTWIQGPFDHFTEPGDG